MQEILILKLTFIPGLGLTGFRKTRRYMPVSRPIVLHIGRFQFDANSPWKFGKISSDEWKSIFRNFRKKGKPCKVYRH